uniref:Uncharacterized protein n=2 Tax=Thermorudis TaxID=1649508 RepID=A0A7C3AAQ4_9BACT
MACLRFSTTARHDPRFRALSLAERAVLLALLCVEREEGAIPAPSLALAVDVSDGDLALLESVLEKSVTLGLLVRDGASYRSHAWYRAARYPSDLPEATRERKRRSRARDVTSVTSVSRDVTSGHERVTTCHERVTSASRASHEGEAEVRLHDAENTTTATGASADVTSVTSMSRDVTSESRAVTSASRGEREPRRDEENGVAGEQARVRRARGRRKNVIVQDILSLLDESETNENEKNERKRPSVVSGGAPPSRSSPQWDVWVAHCRALGCLDATGAPPPFPDDAERNRQLSIAARLVRRGFTADDVAACTEHLRATRRVTTPDLRRVEAEIAAWKMAEQARRSDLGTVVAFPSWRRGVSRSFDIAMETLLKLEREARGS